MSHKEPTDIEIRVTTEGNITPLRFTWRKSWYSVAQIGRSWVDAEGEHWLVMTNHPSLVIELIHTQAGSWLAVQKPARPAMA
ncbi:MAG: hypothetical protein JXB30_20265 [Anaerolineae bacterium]|nr:hypothetical protein [Anaerolineae bacterium]